MATIQYNVTNQTAVTRTLTMTPITGVTQITTGADVCTQPFTLTSKQSCILTLSINGSHAPAHIITSPEICKAKMDGASDPFLCSRSSFAHRLNITRVPENMSGLSVTPSILTLTASGASGNLTITNLSSGLTARNVAANLGALDAHITQDATNCITVLPGASCNLNFASVNIPVPVNQVPVTGTNTSITTGAIGVNGPPDQTIAITAGSPLTLTTSNANTGTMIISNTSGAEIAAGVTAHVESTALNGYVTSDTCPAIPAGGSCTLTFTAGSTVVNPTEFPIYGEKTTSAVGIITIITPYAYLTSSNSNQVHHCVISSQNESFINCTLQNLSTLNNPRGIVINPAGTLAYVTNDNGFSGSVSQCTINTSTGSFDNSCINSGATNLDRPRDIVINASNSYAYIADFQNKMVQCVVTGTGALNTCSALSVSSGVQLNGVAINPNNTLLYVSDFNVENMFECILSGGSLTSCRVAFRGPSLFRSAGVAINAAKTFVYVGASSNQAYGQCFLRPNGSMAQCTNLTQSPQYTWGIALLD